MERLKNLLIKHEGLKFKPYKCTAGKLTIGVGRNLEDVGLSAVEVDLLLKNDIARVNAEAFKAFAWMESLSRTRQDVVLSMIFNLGLEGFKKFKKTIAAIEGGHYDLAAQHMLQSIWAQQVGMRAIDLAHMMATDQYP